MTLGRARFTGDAPPPDALHLAVVRSDLPRAAIDHIDLPAAGTVPGMVAAFTARDLEPVPELAARLGLSFYVPYQGRKQLEKHKAVYAEAARQAGKPEADTQRLLADVAVMETSFVADSNDESYRDAKAGVDWMAECVRSVNKPEDLDKWPQGLRELLHNQIERPDRGYEDYDSYWKAFLFGSSDAGNSIMVDKPPAALWVMALSARIFGVNAWSILVPQALMGVASVGVLYATVRRWHAGCANGPSTRSRSWTPTTASG